MTFKIMDRVKVIDPAHKQFGKTGAVVVLDSETSVCGVSFKHDFSMWMPNSALAPADEPEPPIQVTTTQRTVTVREVESVTINLPAERWRELMNARTDTGIWENFRRDVQDAIRKATGET